LDEGYLAVSGEVEARAARKMRTAKIWNHDSGERLKTIPYKFCRTSGCGTRACGQASCGARDLDLLVTEAGIERFVGAVAKDEADGKFKIIEAVVDSGAEESVEPPGRFPGALVPSRTSKAGGKHRAANGARIPNLGQVRVP
jgi:hypothetical protein